jgi:dihydrofolate reductase
MTTIDFSIVVAHDKELGIGKDGDMPWHLPKDLAHFKAITTETPLSVPNSVIMGRKTWESIPERFRPLPDRLNIVLSRSPLALPDGVYHATSLDEALELSVKLGSEKRFVIGGGIVFKEGLNHPGNKALYVTHIGSTYDCDTFFENYETKYSTKEHLSSVDDNGTPLDFFRLS